ncbi:phosphate signaling complex protein PhoU [Sodalis ligni]|uniref:phosphate signaling complex protein PhoU n=1 Tax=Sodalis ligni TaxID=2697027 RepID=UPI00193FA738|nr:phosphate signaling complex protein PhoU [Sodalis ligni]QWA11216.1 phosphate signaling complex protein PhoU [Sodalis ligni]
MENLNLNKHISGQFNAELEHIRTQVMAMGGLVEQQLTDAISAMHSQDEELAKRVVAGDVKVNMMEVSIDEACVRIIAKRQPTASDLRLVISIIKTISELERIGDGADKICRTALEKYSQQHLQMLVSLESLGRHTIQMLHDVLDAFARMDLDEAIRIYREDKKVDQEYEGIVRQLMTYMMEDPRTIPSVLTALFCARSIERIGDRCQNICEYIFYFVKGQDFRHVGGDALETLLTGTGRDVPKDLAAQAPDENPIPPTE